MKKIYIVGGDGFARECYNNLIALDEYGKSIEFGGFLGHNGYGCKVDYKSYQSLYLHEMSEHDFKDDEYCVIGAGYPHLRVRIYEDLKAKGAKFYTLIAKGIKMSDSVEFGEANVFCPPFCPTVNIKIGNGNVFNGCFGVGHDCEIGDFNFLGPNCALQGYVKIGSFNTIAANAIFLAHAKIGDFNKISPLSVVYKGCKSNCLMHGNPALKIGEVEFK